MPALSYTRIKQVQAITSFSSSLGSRSVQSAYKTDGKDYKMELSHKAKGTATFSSISKWMKNYR